MGKFMPTPTAALTRSVATAVVAIGLAGAAPAAGQPAAAPSAAATPPLAVVQKQLRDARAELSMNAQLLAQPEIAEGAKQALKNRSESLVQNIARLKELEHRAIALQAPPAVPASEARP